MNHSLLTTLVESGVVEPMKKFFSVLAVILFVMAITGTIFAQEKMIAPILPDDGMPAQLFGQNQSYSVVFRGNGEAVVNLRLSFTNTQTSNLTSLALRIPKVEPKDMFAFQVIRPGPCLRYAPVGTLEGQNALYVPTSRCLLYDDPPDPYSWYGPAKYQKAVVQYAGDTVTITLPQPIKPEKFGNILLYYRAFGYAKKDIVGTYHFTFETLQAQDQVEQVDVGIATDTNLLLRGTKENVNYRFEDAMVASRGVADMAAPSANTRLDAYYQQIGSGQLIKSASGLQAFESFTIRGSYADNALRLYAKEIAIGIAVFVVIVLLTIGILRLAIKSLTVLAVVGVSFLSAVFMLGYTVIIIFLIRNLPVVLSYDYPMQLPIVMVLLIISLGIYGFLLFAPAIFIGMKRGIVYGLVTAGLTLGWLILAVVLFTVISAFSGNPSYPVPLRMTSGIEMQAQPALPD